MFDVLLVHPQSQELLEGFIQKPPHAVLLSGLSGIGLTTIATALAKQLLHGNQTDSLENEQYFRQITPKDGHIPIESIRNLQSFFRLKVPGNSGVKRVVIIDQADAMQSAAQNALLKMLEEPPVGTVFILTSSRPDALLATIHSRVTLLALATPTKEQAFAFFGANGYAAADIERAYMLAEGAPKFMSQQLAGTASDDTSLTLVKQVLGSQTFERLLVVEKLSKDKPAAAEFVATLVQVASASLERAAAQNPGGIANWQRILQSAVTAQNALALNGNTKLVLTDLLLTL